MRFRHSVLVCVLGIVLLGLQQPNVTFGESLRQSDSDSVTVEFTARRTQVVRTDSGFIKRFVGDVSMRVNPHVWLTANDVTYDGVHHEVKFTGNVVVVDSGRTLRAEHVDYLFEDHHEADGRPLVRLRQNVSIEDSARRVTAFGVDYWTDDDSVMAFGLVRASVPGGALGADQLWYSAKTGDMTALGKVRLADSTQGFTIHAHEYRWHEADSVAHITGRPLLTKGEGDTTIFVEADFMKYAVRADIAVAWDSVRIDRGALSTFCDSVVFDSRNEQLELFGSPYAAQRTQGDTTTTISEATGERIVLQLDGTRVREIRIYGTRASPARTIASEFDRTGHQTGERWITGNEIVFHVRDDNVERLEIFGQASSHNEPRPSARTSEGVNEASGDTMVIMFEDSRIRKVFLMGGVEGLFRPPLDSTAVSTPSETIESELPDETGDESQAIEYETVSDL